MTSFEEKINAQVDLNKIGIYEVFVNEGELREYWGLKGGLNIDINKKMFAVVFDGEIVKLSFEKHRAIANLLEEAEVDSLIELEERYGVKK